MRIPMRNGEPLGLEEMQERQAQMEDQLNMATSEIQAKEAELIVLRAKVADRAMVAASERGECGTCGYAPCACDQQ